MNITLVQGTARKNNRTQMVTAALQERFNRTDASVTLVTAGEHVNQAATVPPWGEGGANENPTTWKEIAKATDLFVMVIPEYNHGYPGEWKLSLYKEYEGKRVAVVAVSNGTFAGARVMEHVLPVLLELKLQIEPHRLHVGNAGKVFSEEGQLCDEDVEERFNAFVDKLIP